MAFDCVFGQDRVKDMFASSMKRNRLAHAYLFHGQAGVGKDAMALSVGMGLNCTAGVIGGCGECASCTAIMNLENPGFRLVLPVPTRPKSMKEDKYHEIIRDRALQRMRNPYGEVSYVPEFSTLPFIGIDQIRSMRRDVMLKMPGGRHRVFLLSHADRMNVEAANSLLKLLEEPPGNTVLFLTTSMTGQLLKTIVSRCQIVRFDPLKEEQVEEALIQTYRQPKDRARFLARLAGGSLQRALTLAGEDYEEKRNAALSLLEVSLTGDVIERERWVEQFVRRGEKSDIIEILRILQMWIRDLLQQELGFSERAMNIDRIGALEGLRNRWPGFRPESGLKCVEQAIDFIQKNVYLDLVIFSLIQDLRGCR